MDGAIPDTDKRRGRPYTGGPKPGIMLRLPGERLAELDAWIAAQPDPKPSRPEAVRRLMERGLRQQDP